MILTAVKPDDAGMVAGFRHETLHCLVCRDTEHRFVYTRESSEKPELPLISALAQQNVVSSTSVEAKAISSSSPHSSMPQGMVTSPPESSAREAIASVSSWGRAVEKVRTRQADIKMRAGAGKIEKTDLNELPGACDATHRRPKHLVRKSAQALRTELWGPSPTGAIDPPTASIERFNWFWDSLLPARHRLDLPPKASTTSAKPLPRSLSLVQVENLGGVSVAGRAILLLRG